MKIKTIKRLLRRAAKRNGFEIDVITGKGKDDVKLFAEHSNGSSVLLGANRSQRGVVESCGYLNSGFTLYDRSDDIYADIKVRNFKKFINNIDGHFDYLVTPQNIESIAERIDSVPGVSPGAFSTFISINEGQVTAFA